MRKRPNLFYLVAIFCICSLTAFSYFVLDRYVEQEQGSVAISGSNSRVGKEIVNRLVQLESGLKENRKLLDNVRSRVNQVARAVYLDHASGSIGLNNQCLLASDDGRPDWRMRDAYDEIAFDNPDGGAWKQGWNVVINQSRFSADNKLQVLVVPHSHNDPGWIKTFEQYYRDQTQHILNAMLKRLPENPSMKFIWAEISYFAQWWDRLTNENDRERVRALVRRGQLEFVMGGWVMNDEANSHYWSIISQLVDGHEWLRQNLGVKPRYAWSIDPFGYSSSMAFLLKKMGFDGMVIQRVHYSVKKYLAQRQLLEFKWRLRHEVAPSKDIVCHMLPFYSYDIPHSCGPDPKVCCQFDFRRMPPFRINCPWNVPPQRITEANVERRAALLLDQYRKKAMLYRHNVILVPLGDDFRFEKEMEWTNQISNYQRLFDYMNSRQDWHVQARFGTLADYFDALSDKDALPSLEGDFFTYSDRDDHYWSGYYTTRPFHKRYERILESYLRAAEISFSFALMLGQDSAGLFARELDSLNYARQNLALFQHHDGITGTAKDFVVNDYADRMHKSLQKSSQIIAKAVSALLGIPVGTDDDADNVIFLEAFPDYNSNPIRRVLNVNEKQRKWKLILFNSLTLARKELVCIHLNINASHWTLRNESGSKIPVQLNYVWNDVELSLDRIELCFMVSLSSLSLTQYTLEWSDTANEGQLSATTLYNFENNISERLITNAEALSEIELETDRLRLVIGGADGMLRRVVQLDQTLIVRAHEIRAQLMSYGTKSGKKDQKSGAYIFIPDSPEAQVINYGKPKIRLVRGSLFSKIEVIIERPVRLLHRLIVINGHSHFNLENEFQLTKRNFPNRELLIRFYTDIKNQDLFYTDLNGLQIAPRKYYQKIPLQGNVYPVPSLFYIEDDTTRLSIITGQPLGGTSSHPGFVDIFLDRVLLQDDARGLAQGVTDNRHTREVFKMLFEPRPQQSTKPTLQVQRELHTLLHPPLLMASRIDDADIAQHVSFVDRQPWPCDLHLLGVRARDTLQQFHLTVHKWDLSCDAACDEPQHSIRVDQLLDRRLLSTLKPMATLTSLSLMHDLRNVSFAEEVSLEPLDFLTFALQSHDEPNSI